MKKFDVYISSIKELANIIKKGNLSKIEIKLKEEHIIITREVNPVATQNQPINNNIADSTAVNNTVETSKAKDNIDENVTIIKSPIVGTAYLAPTPNDKPFVSVGDKVKKGDIIVIVEAMKVMNTIIATTDGKIKEILVDNAQPVEFNQPLITIE